MLNTLRQRLGDDEDDGFTLIELMVVVLIIAILIAIAIPTFLGARERAQDRAAQSSLRNALTAAKTLYTDNGNYSSANATNLKAVEPSLNYQTAASTDEKIISVASSSTNFSAAALSDSGKCFMIKDVGSGASAGTTYGTNATCTGAQADTSATASSW